MATKLRSGLTVIQKEFKLGVWFSYGLLVPNEYGAKMIATLAV